MVESCVGDPVAGLRVDLEVRVAEETAIRSTREHIAYVLRTRGQSFSLYREPTARVLISEEHRRLVWRVDLATLETTQRVGA